MSPAGGGRRGRTDSNTVSVDANTVGSLSDVVNIDDDLNVSFAVTAGTGTHATHEFHLQESPNGTDWFAVGGSAMVGLGASQNLVCVFQQVRVRCRTAEGSSSTVSISIQTK